MSRHPFDQLGFRAAQDDPLDVEQLRILRESETQLHDAFKRRHHVHNGAHSRAPDEFPAAVRLYQFRTPEGVQLVTPKLLPAAEPLWSAGIWSDDTGWETVEVGENMHHAFSIVHPPGFRVREVRADVAGRALGAPWTVVYDELRNGVRVRLSPYVSASHFVIPIAVIWSILIVVYLARD